MEVELEGDETEGEKINSGVIEIIYMKSLQNKSESIRGLITKPL